VPAAGIIAAFFLALGLTAQGRPDERVRLVVCGWDEVAILDFAAGLARPPQRLWSWRARGRADLPDEIEPLFRTTDECKPVDGGARILLTSSGGAVALVDRKADRVLFYARAANAHSAELLPGGRIVVAASHDPRGRGDRLILFDAARSGHELWSGELPWAHGVVWDARRNLLWALGEHDVRAYELRDWASAAPSLQRRTVVALPESGGHNLSAVPGTAWLALSTSTRCWLFDRDTLALRPHPALGDRPRVKSIDYGPAGQLVYVQAETDHWWTERIQFLSPPGTLHVPGEHFYKARWYPAER
jgi:hypothetical protein